MTDSELVKTPEKRYPRSYSLAQLSHMILRFEDSDNGSPRRASEAWGYLESLWG